MHRVQQWWVVTLVAVAVLWSLGGCVTIDAEAAKARTQGKVIAVSATTSGHLRLIWIGTTIFNNEYGNHPVPSWDIDAVVRTGALNALAATGRYAHVVAVDVTRQGDAVPILPSDVSADFLLLVDDEWTSRDVIWSTNQLFDKIGIAQRSFMGLVPLQTRAYANLRMTLFDLHLGQKVGWTSHFEHWPVDFHLTSGGKATFTGPYPEPQIAESDVQQLRVPMLERLKTMTSTLSGEMGLR